MKVYFFHGQEAVTLKTLQNAAAAIGAHLEMKLVFNKKAA